LQEKGPRNQDYRELVKQADKTKR